MEVKKIISVLSSVLILMAACQSSRFSSDRVEGEIKGLKKGTLYLSVIRDGKPVPVDSLRLEGSGKFVFELDTLEPQLLMLSLKEKPADYILFFADDTVNLVYTSLDKMGVYPRLKGGPNLRAWQEYKRMIAQYNDKRVEAVKNRLESQRKGDTIALRKAEQTLASVEKRRRLYAWQFAFTHKDLPVGAYVALVELNRAPAALDTLYKAMPPRIRQSLYGRMIASVLDTVKASN
ncbi:MAG: DUF4369 domain-containing protein [Chlorobi bacterium]|nr:DUF4369 domain-containing protein [Chlorobiota bacterium]